MSCEKERQGIKDDAKFLSVEPGQIFAVVGKKKKKRKGHRKIVEVDCHLHSYIKSSYRGVHIAGRETINSIKKMLSKTKNKWDLGEYAVVLLEHKMDSE